MPSTSASHCPSGFGRAVGPRRERAARQSVVEARVGVVGARVARAARLGVVRRRALRHAARTRLRLCGGGRAASSSSRLRRASASALSRTPSTSSRSKPPRRLLGGEVDAEAHARRDRPLEVDHPAQLVGDDEVAPSWRSGSSGGADGSGPTSSGERIGAPSAIDAGRPARRAMQHEAVGQQRDARRLRPRASRPSVSHGAAATAATRPTRSASSPCAAVGEVAAAGGRSHERRPRGPRRRRRPSCVERLAFGARRRRRRARPPSQYRSSAALLRRARRRRAVERRG